MDKTRMGDMWNVKFIDTIVTRPDIVVYKGERQNELVAVKVHTREEVFKREVDSLKRLHAKGVRVPKVVDAGKVGDHFVIVEEWLGGKPLEPLFSNYDDRKQVFLMERIGCLLAEVQFALSAEELDAACFWQRSNEDKLSAFSWRSYMESQVKKWIGRVKRSEEDSAQHLETYFAAIAEKVRTLAEPERVTLIHCDYGFRNLHITSDESDILGVLDFEGVAIGDPLWDLAKLQWYDLQDEREDCQHAFLRGWEKEAKQPVDMVRLNFYQALECLAGIAWVDKQPEMNDDLRRLRRRSVAGLARFCRRF
ncbi:phosphotransferase family protein [Shouchella lonarensis]|nr:phosphotransferase [Shouchella lonarensis]